VVREALERMWPVLSPADLLRDLFGSKALLRLAASKWLSEDEWSALYRDRAGVIGGDGAVLWSEADVALLDEARELLGPRPGRPGGQGEAEIRTYGHIVVDEVQDLTPMQLRMIARRSLNGSMTVVGDIAQATGPFAPNDWSELLTFLPDRRPARLVELTIGYRIPEQIMALANRVLRVAAPQIHPPVAVRGGDEPPRVHRVSSDGLSAEVVAGIGRLQAELGEAGIAVVVPTNMVESVDAALTAAGVAHGVANRSGLGADVTVVPVGLAKGLELDGVVLVEPGRIVADERQGLRALYVALTRATKRLDIVHSDALPEALVDAE
jgi:DNA helicase IV